MILVVDMNYKKDSLSFFEFVSPIIAVIKPLGKWSVKHYLEVSDEDLSGCDGIILSGTALKDVATLKQPEKFQWLKATEKPVLGICAGMETIGMVFGARLSSSLEVGMTLVETVKENSLCSGNFKVYSLHSVCVEPSADFDVWAKSTLCIQVMKHKRKHIYGVLFHPEVRNQEILKRFIQVEKIQQ